MGIKRFFLTVITIMCLPLFSFSAITVNINSGNPLMPFPQFINYANGYLSIADSSVQPDGVAHAEMEQWIRDAWKIHSNEFNYNGTVTYGANVLKLIQDSSSPYCSEGHGYALLAAAMMCDKDAFMGLWCYLNENGYFSKTLKYSTGVMVNGAYVYGAHAPGVYGPGSDTAADGDMDIAMAALIAWKQWGDGTGYYAPGGTGPAGAGGNEIQFKQMALDMLRFLVEKDQGVNFGDQWWSSGDIGFDGYERGGNTGGGHAGEATAWGSTTGLALYGAGPQFSGPSTNYYDYSGAGYLDAFGCALQANADPRDLNTSTGGWSNVNQFRRSARADDWLQNQLQSGNLYPVAGLFDINEAAHTASFTVYNSGEDFRSPWRKGLDNLWFGNPAETWNPTTHQPVAGGNTYQYDTAVKFSNFFKNNIPCRNYGGPVTYNGIAGAGSDYAMDGTPGVAFHLNWIFGTGAADFLVGAKASGNYTQAGEVFRELMILWDSVGGTDTYLNSIPHYFHGWFRQLGLEVMTGNAFNPCTIASTANMKVYKAVNKTYSFAGDTISYYINYRNYGHTDATAVYIRDTLAAEYNFVSSVPAATALGGNVYEWGPFTVTGMKNQLINPTLGAITITVQVKGTAGMTKICNTADIRCSNGTGWRSNEIPNEITTTCETNCVDIVPAALTISKTASAYLANGGDTITYTIQYCNSANAGWINGGRSGVNFSFGADAVPGTTDNTLTFYLRANHAAAEPVINWANYRISYFLNSSYHGASWNVDLDYVDGFPAGSQIVSTQDLVPGSDAQGSWNQRIMLQFGNATTQPTHQLFNVAGVGALIHMGATLMPFIIKGRIHAAYNSQDWTDDWSQPAAWETATQNDPLWPVSPDWTKGDGTSVPVTKINADACQTSAHSINNILIEEFDGYTWRRVFGNGPQPGRQVNNVVVTDSLPTQVTFGGWLGTAGTQAGRNLSWTTPSMLVSECQTRKYWVTVNAIGCPGLDQYADNIAFVKADNEFPVSDAVRVTITCAAVPTPTPAPASLTKTANAAVYNNGDLITYTINYANTYGSIINDPLTSAANWTNRGTGADLVVGGGKVAANSANTAMTCNTSNGTNGTIITRMHVQSSAVFGVVLRHTAVSGMANGVYVTFKPNPPGNGEVRFWNGTTQIGTTQGILINNDFDLKVLMTGGTIVCYIDNTLTQSFEGFATPVSMAGMTVQAGYAGVINGTPANADAYSNTHYISSWHTELDTSYNTAVLDTIPAGVLFTGGDNGASSAGGVVSWPTIAVLNLNQSITYKWWGTVTGSCQNVTNTVRVFPQGIITPIIAATVIKVNCGATTPTFTPTRTMTLTFTATFTPTYTPTATPSFTNTQSPTYTRTNTPTFTYTPSNTPSPTPSFTNTPSTTFSLTQTLSNTPSRTASPTFTATVSVTYTNTYTNTNTPSYTRTVSPTFSVTDTMSSNTPTFTLTSTRSYTASPTWTPSVTYTLTSTNTDTPTSSATMTSTGTSTYTYTVTSVNTATFTPTYTNTFTFTQTATLTHTLTVTDTESSNTPTWTLTWTNTATVTQSWTDTDTKTFTPTLTGTPTFTCTATLTGTPVIFTSTVTPTWTPTGTYTSTPTQSATLTDSPTWTSTRTDTQTLTYTNTWTSTFTRTATSTITQTPTVTPTARPSPVTLDISLATSGDNPKIGGQITYTITIQNNTSSPVTNIAVWDTLPAGMVFNASNSVLMPSQTGNYIFFDASKNPDSTPFTLNPGEQLTIQFTATLMTVDPADLPLLQVVKADYNDPYYVPSLGKHPPIKTEESFYPLGDPVVFPNPFNLDTNHKVTFDNVVPGSLIEIFTLAGEDVKAITTGITKASWDGKNRNGKAVSPGIYFFVIKNQATGQAKTGKLFVVRGN